jgi:transketolase
MITSQPNIDRNDPFLWHELAQQLRVDAVRATAAAGSGHPSSGMSAADLIAVLLARHLRYDFDHPEDPANDHLIFSKGARLAVALRALPGRGRDHRRGAHELPPARQPTRGPPNATAAMVDVATGSLGLGLPVGVGIALAGKSLDRLPYRVWVLTGDSELAEGSIWEAFARAAHAGLDNLVAIADVNRLGQSGETMLGWETATYAARVRAFGWRAIEIDGHDLTAINQAYAQALRPDGRPVAIFARTLKGKGVAAIENRNAFHGKPLADPEAAIAELGGSRTLLVPPQRPIVARSHMHSPHRDAVRLSSWSPGELVATPPGARPHSVCLDLRRLLDPRPRLHSHGRDQPRRHPPRRIPHRRRSPSAVPHR